MAADAPANAMAKISLSLGAVKKPTRIALSNGVKRPHAALGDHEDEESEIGRAKTVSHFDKTAGGAVDAENDKPVQGPLVIKKLANRDWKQASKRKRQKSVLPGREEQRQGQDLDALISARDTPTYGLNIRRKHDGEPAPVANGERLTAEMDDISQADRETHYTPARQKTDDELVMDALLGVETKSNVLILAVTEEEAFERDYNSAPPAPTLDEYAAVPVEEFGAAMLRGMGWKEGEGIGSQRGKKVQVLKQPERRPALLGIGAKEEAAVTQEMGTWGKAAKDRKGPTIIYNPIVLRNKVTGETLTEEELKKKQEAGKQREMDQAWEVEQERRRKEKESRRREGDSEEDERDHERRKREKRRAREDEKHHSSRRDRSRSRERSRRKSNRDDERYRKDKQRRREREYDDDYDRGDRRRELREEVRPREDERRHR